MRLFERVVTLSILCAGAACQPPSPCEQQCTRHPSDAGGHSDAGAVATLPSFQPLFATGFEADEAVGCEGSAAAPTCGEASLAHSTLFFFDKQPTTDWTQWDLRRAKWSLGVYYEVDAGPDARFVRMIDDPTQAGNRVLHLSVAEAVIPVDYRNHKKGRVQTQTVLDPPTTELYSRQRIYVHPDLGKLVDYPASGDPWWIAVVIQEMRAGSPARGDPYSFLMDVVLTPDVTAKALRLNVTGRKAGRSGAWETVWAASDPLTAVPVGQWLTLETAYRQGGCCSGRFAAVLWNEAGTQPLISLEVTGWTYNPDAPGPVALNAWGGVQKLYTSDNVIQHIRSQGGVAQLYFDDFAVAMKWPEGWEPPPLTGVVSK